MQTIDIQIVGTNDIPVVQDVTAPGASEDGAAVTGSFDGDDADTEPDYPTQIGVIDDGPLWVCGGVSITTSDGTELETRSRVTLCRCGASANKPLCDGSHKEAGFADS